MLSKRVVPFKIIVFFGIIALLFTLNTGALAAGEPIQIKLASFQPSTSKTYEEFVKWSQLIEKETGGKVKFVLYPGATLAKPRDTYDATAKGIADIGWTLSGYTRGRFLLSEVVALPLGLRNAEHASRVMCDLYDMFPEIRAEYKDVHLLWLSPGNARQIHSMVPIRKVEDFKGKKTRVPGSEAPNVKALGGVPVSIAGPDVYQALERGVLDVDLHPWESAYTYRWYEVVKYHTQADLYGGGLFICAMNLNTWNKLPADVKKVFDKYSGRYGSIEVSGINMWDKWDTYYKDWLKKNTKNEIIEWSEQEKEKARKLMNDVLLPKWVADADKKGAPGQKILDETIKLIKKY